MTLPTKAVLHAATYPRKPELGAPCNISIGEFDDWLTETIRQSKEQAWNQGAEAVALLIPEYEWHDRGLRLPTNPYRKQP